MEIGMLAGQVARELGVSVSTLAAFERSGKLTATRTSGRWRLFSPKEVLRLKRQMERQKCIRS